METTTGHLGFVQVERIEVGWMSIEQARQFCECGEETLRRAVRHGRVKAFVKKASTPTASYRKGWWFEREELARWIADGKPTAALMPVAPEPDPMPLLADAKPLIDSDIRLLYKMMKDLEAKLEAVATDVKVLRTELMG